MTHRRVHLLGAMLASLVASATLLAQEAIPRVALAASDWRQAWVGRWRIEYALDSIRPDAVNLAFQVGSGAHVVGTLTIAPVLVGPQQLASTLRLTLPNDVPPDAPAFGTLSRTIRLTRDTSGVVGIQFEPNVDDAGVIGSVRRDGTGAVGTWQQTSFAGSLAKGRLWLRPER